MCTLWLLWWILHQRSRRCPLYLSNRTCGQSLSRLFASSFETSTTFLFSFFLFFSRFKTIFAYFIHVLTMVNVFPKVPVDVVFAPRPTMVMIVEKVTNKSRQVKVWKISMISVYRPNPCDNIYCGYGQCREGICECHGGYTGSQCDVARKFLSSSLDKKEKWEMINLADLCASINCHYGQCYEGRCTCYDGYIGDYCDMPSKKWHSEFFKRLFRFFYGKL